jgi:hypothetical protein
LHFTAPDALDKLKSAFKGLFRRNKKPKTSTSTPSSAAPPNQQPAPPTTASVAAAPQLPPIQNASPIHSVNATDADVNKPLPPTHPLATGQHEQPQQAVPVNADAKPGPPAPMVGPAETKEQVQEQQKGGDSASPVSPPPQPTSAQPGPSQPSSAQPVSVVDGTSGDVSAVSDATNPREETKTDSAVEGMKAEDSAGINQHFTTADRVLMAAVTTEQGVPNKENIPPNSTASTAATTGSDERTAPNGPPAPPPISTLVTTDADETTPASPEEKVAILNEEPPPIKVSKPAPGMSATSGPLEDFPEGGDMRDP